MNEEMYAAIEELRKKLGADAMAVVFRRGAEGIGSYAKGDSVELMGLAEFLHVRFRCEVIEMWREERKAMDEKK